MYFFGRKRCYQSFKQDKSVAYRSVVSQNKIAWIFKIHNIFETVSPFSCVRINNNPIFNIYRVLSYCKITEQHPFCYLKMFHLVPTPSYLQLVVDKTLDDNFRQKTISIYLIVLEI